MNIQIVTLFPEFFPGPIAVGLLGKALDAGLARVGYVDPRSFVHDKHRTVDDTPYGGGGGMLMKPEPLARAIQAARALAPGPVLLMSPQGRPLAQEDLRRWSLGQHLVLVAGRYEGFDERVGRLVDEEISLGDFVLTGGEYAALVILDGVVRLLPGTLGNAASPIHDSFSEGLLEHPQYTRPVEFAGERVPEVLLSGNHREVLAWRSAQSLLRTRLRRPDLLLGRGFDSDERAALALAARPGSLALVVPAGRRTALERLAEAYQVELRGCEGPEVLAPKLAQPESGWVLSAEAGPEHAAQATAPAEVQRRLRAGETCTLVLGRELSPALLTVPEPRRLRLPSVRAAGPTHPLGLSEVAAILLDRLLGEG